MDYCEHCNGKKEIMGLGLVTQTCSGCLGTGLKKEAEATVNKKPKMRIKKTEKDNLLNAENEQITERTNGQTNQALPSLCDTPA
jgi:DnaJ-class molecular chaperone